MISKILLVLDNFDYLDDYRKVGITTFLFPLKEYCVGYNDFSLEEINKCDVSNKYILINRVLDCKGIDEFKKIIKKFKNIKGLVFEDIGIYQSVKKIGLDLELILFQNHFNCNKESINFWLDRVDSVVVSNELTFNELKYITDNSKKEVVLHLYGYNQVMYSRRKLLTNFSEEFNLINKSKNIIEDKATHIKFRVFENDYGTVMYSDKIFNGKRLIDLNNIKYFYVNTTMINHKELMDFLTTNRDINDSEDEGFLDRETIYKLKER